MTVDAATPTGTVSVEDRAALIDLLARYCWGLNTGDADAVLATFAQDAVFEHLPNPPLRGRDGILGMLEYLWYDRPGAFVGRQHHATNHLIRGDGERASVRAYWHTLHWEQDPRGRLYQGSLGHWDNIAVKQDGEWRWQRVLVVPWENGQLPWAGESRAFYRFQPPGSGDAG